ncbi:MAG: hypothetical protein A2W05_00185 [Candidatus Schekmanbacteria bacterium RBG_16_38_10]|uniref:HEPN domain-containing protein n=1 Tax=Candidatus Schekmanbacteria bacterium RBG_16_38_10 TaxID=1817879 RepID=A0A1F7RNQ5_9BACT|nr:MAG: hypothetical protein A2W05_00185 [Candidatus Schekmanbacteria bacterium RBG_16_38_10]
MSYPGGANIPKRFREILPDVALEVYTKAYKFAWVLYKGDNERSIQFAWKAVRASINEMIVQNKIN